MSRILVCGDIHGTLNIGKLQQYFADKEDEFTKEDYLIICGDVAVCGFNRESEIATREYLQSFPVTVLFCDGNHENFEALNSYPVDEWMGGKVHKIEEDIIHLMRGQVFEICGLKFFVFGGAYSVDRTERIKGVTWFEEELPSEEEYEEAFHNLESVGNKVDYVITHTAPYEVVAELGYGSFDEAADHTKRLQMIADSIDFEDWMFGHFHEDADVLNYHCLMDEVIEL